MLAHNVPKEPPTEEVVARFWHSSSNFGSIVPPRKLSYLLNPSWLPAPQNNTTKRKVHLKPQPQSTSQFGTLTRLKGKLKGKSQSLRSSPRQTFSSTGVTKPSQWYAEHLHCDFSMQRVCRLPTATLNKTFALVNDLIDDVSNSNASNSKTDEIPSNKAIGLNPWEELTPPAVFSEIKITVFYSDLLYWAFLPALSILLTRNFLNTKHGKCREHPRFFKVGKDTQDQSEQSLLVMVSTMLTPKPDVLVSLETFGSG